jgi:hypothetical protein
MQDDIFSALMSWNLFAEGKFAIYFKIFPFSHNGEMSARDGPRSQQ